MINVNTAIITGRVSRDPYFREEGEDGRKPMLLFTVAVGKPYKQEDVTSESVSFIDCAVFGRHAPWLYENMPKGTFVIVQGGLNQRLVPQDDGRNISKTSITAQKVILPPRPINGQATQEEQLIPTIEETYVEQASGYNTAAEVASSSEFTLSNEDIKF